MRRLILFPAVGILLLAFMGLAFVAFDPGRWSALGDHLSSVLPAPRLAAKLTVETVTVEGRSRTDRELLLTALGTAYGSDMATVDVSGAKQRIEALPWVERAIVERRLPNTVHVTLFEQVPFAVWQQGPAFFLIDETGQKITQIDVVEDGLPLLVGSGAPEAGRPFLASLNSESALAKRVKAAALISERRWDVYLDDRRDGVQIKLPAETALEAWNKLAVLDRRYGITKRGVASIDLRIPGQLIVSLKDGRQIRDLNDLQAVRFSPVRGVPG